jgi:hypothetical protein
MQTVSLCLALFAAHFDVRDGTVIALENGNRVVQYYTKSEVTQVALILNDGGKPWVYEATPHEVRKLMLADYYAELGEINRHRHTANQMRIRLYQPVRPYTDQQIIDVRAYLNRQLGRRYSVKSYVRDKPSDGVHCAELVSTALTHTGREQFARAYAVNPSVLVSRIAPHHDAPLEVDLPDLEPVDTWCRRSWNWWSGLYVWCGWACGETWRFCW